MTAVESEFYVQVGKRLARLRRRQGMTQQQLADAVGVARPTVANLEAGRSGVSAYRLYLFCRELECDVLDVLPAQGDVPPPRALPVSVTLTVGPRRIRFDHVF